MLVEIHTSHVLDDPKLLVYQVELEEEGIWRESFGSRPELEKFLRGVEAGYNMGTGKFLRLPEIPTEPFVTANNSLSLHTGDNKWD